MRRAMRERMRIRDALRGAASSAIGDELTALIARLVARQGEQLLHQVNRALDRRAEIGARLEPRRLVRRSIEQLQLQTNRRQRRAQLVGGIGNEGALRLKCRMQAHQQAIELFDQRRDFLRQPVRGDGRQAVHIALLHFDRNALQRQQAAAHDADDRRTQHRQQQQQRYHHAQRRAARQLLAHPHRLRDLNHAVERLQPVGAPRLGPRRAHPRSPARFD